MGGLHLKNPKVPQGFQQRPFSRKGEGGVWLVADLCLCTLGQEDPLEKEMATHSSTWKIPRMEEPGRLQSMGSQTEQLTQLSNFTFTFHFLCVRSFIL